MTDLEKTLEVEKMPPLIRDKLIKMRPPQLNINGTKIVLNRGFKKPYKNRFVGLSQDEVWYLANSASKEAYALVYITGSSPHRTELNVEPISGVALNHLLDPSVDLIIYPDAMMPKSIKRHRHPPESQHPKSRYK